MSPVIYVGATIAAVALLFALRGWYLYAFRWTINANAFMAQIQKLIMANNIDRAIKLCNAEPTALLPRAIKSLLVLANRPYSLFLAHEEAMAHLRAETAMYRQFGGYTFFFAILVTAFLSIGLGQGLEGGDLQAVQGCMIAAAAAALLAWYNQVRLIQHTAVIEEMALLTRGHLYNRSGYKPPMVDPVEMTDEEIEEWRQSMDIIEEESVVLGPDTAADLHDSQVDKRTGVLPPL